MCALSLWVATGREIEVFIIAYCRHYGCIFAEKRATAVNLYEPAFQYNLRPDAGAMHPLPEVATMITVPRPVRHPSWK